MFFQSNLLSFGFLFLSLNTLISPGLLELGHSNTEDVVSELQNRCKDLPATWPWWAVRALTTQQRILRGLSSSLRAALSALIPMVNPPSGSMRYKIRGKSSDTTSYISDTRREREAAGGAGGTNIPTEYIPVCSRTSMSGRGINTREAPTYRKIPLNDAQSACGTSQNAHKSFRLRLSRLSKFDYIPIQMVNEMSYI
jgi:hypothetical protein